MGPDNSGNISHDHRQYEEGDNNDERQPNFLTP